MSFSEQKKITESICATADGFCFSPHPDSKGEITVCGPTTVIPGSSSQDKEQLKKLFQIVYPSSEHLEVVTDSVPGYDVTILTGIPKKVSDIITTQYSCAPIRSHLHDILKRIRTMDYAVIYAGRHESFTDIVAADDGRILFLNTIYMKDPYETVYYVVKVWKELGFCHEKDRIWLSGFENCNENFIRNIRLMTGDNTICEL